MAHEAGGLIRWRMLALGLAAWAVGAAAVYQLSLLLPSLRAETDISIGTAGTLVGIANAGLAVGLLGWGMAADRYGERRVMAFGLAVCGTFVGAAAATEDVPLLAVALGGCGLAAGSVYAPSGRLVLKWFPARQRGLAMSITQTSTPLSSALAAATLPGMAAEHGYRPAMLVMAVACLAVALLVALFVRAAPETAEASEETGPGSEARGPRSGLRRMYIVSVLLFLPQISLLTFAVSYLVDTRGWSAAHAGEALSVALLLTLVTRPVIGHWSDQVGRRLGLMRGIAILNVAVMGALVTGTVTGSRLGTAAVLVAVTSMITGSGLIATTVAEFADRTRTGRALGVQNTLQGGVAVLAPIVLGSTVDLFGYTAAFGMIAVAPLLAAIVVPVAAERAAVAAACSGARERDGGTSVSPP
ncbi:MFS transporter [Spirillospora sp. NBC_00431]